MGLQDSAMLVKIGIGIYSNERIDHESAQELATQHKVDKYVKARRISLPEYTLDPIRRIVGDIRLYHAANTLPFLDRGVRLLPSDNYFEYIQGLSKRTSAFETAVSTFITNLPIYIAEAKQKFGDRFDETRVPAIEELHKKFYISPVFMPIADHADWRLDLENAELERLKNDYAIQLVQAQEANTELLWDEIIKELDHFIDRMETPKAKLFATLLPNLNQLAKVTIRLNTAKDEMLNDICTSIVNTVSSGYDVDDLRHANTKLDVLGAAQAIRSRIRVHKSK